MTGRAAEELELVYDDECPLCRTYCRSVKMDDPAARLALIDARRDGPQMREITALGLDIDQGMVLKAEGRIYYGPEAMHQLSLRAQRSGWTGWMNRLFFSSPRAARINYALAKSFRAVLLKLIGVDDINNLKAGNALKRQLGRGWEELHPDIRNRFDRDPAPGETVLYAGVMQEIRRSRMGWLFAEFTRVIGNPLTPHAGRDIPMEVALSKAPHKEGVYWRRSYLFPGRKPYVVTSVKRESSRGEMLECVGGGFGMKLKVYARDGALHFESYRYFWSFLGWMLPLPHWLSPGRTHVVHRDLGGGDFMFKISMVHDQLGETYFQQGVFRRKEL
jgi:predicted DCC family thiol-disulfide oxidoreductase YuxK